mmetsp:Transcript_10826/g.27334  ORF Transcript_10826/g.27334 Transcript_10826/m.27334 type:complete len:240 (-) Transcript_10826:579-1298(-)
MRLHEKVVYIVVTCCHRKGKQRARAHLGVCLHDGPVHGVSLCGALGPAPLSLLVRRGFETRFVSIGIHGCFSLSFSLGRRGRRRGRRGRWAGVHPSGADVTVLAPPPVAEDHFAAPGRVVPVMVILAILALEHPRPCHVLVLLGVRSHLVVVVCAVDPPVAVALDVSCLHASLAFPGPADLFLDPFGAKEHEDALMDEFVDDVPAQLPVGAERLERPAARRAWDGAWWPVRVRAEGNPL